MISIVASLRALERSGERGKMALLQVDQSRLSSSDSDPVEDSHSALPGSITCLWRSVHAICTEHSNFRDEHAFSSRSRFNIANFTSPVVEADKAKAIQAWVPQ